MYATRPPSCVPTWQGYIETTKDALLIFEACFQGVLHHCSRRPHDRERNQLIVSGNVFVYEEATSGIKRWTDGIPWSPSRILTNFLIYRQLNSPFPPGEKKRATRRNQRGSRPSEGGSGPLSAETSQPPTPTTDRPSSFSAESSSDGQAARREEEGSGGQERDADRGLVGSLTDSYEFKEGGLLKKTMTVTVGNVQHHLVSYYSLEDAKYNLKTPRTDDRLKDLQVCDALLKQPKFKFPNLDDAGDGANAWDTATGAPTGYPGGYYAFDQSRAAYMPTAYGYPYGTGFPYQQPQIYPQHYPSAGYSPAPPPSQAAATAAAAAAAAAGSTGAVTAPSQQHAGAAAQSPHPQHPYAQQQHAAAYQYYNPHAAYYYQAQYHHPAAYAQQYGQQQQQLPPHHPQQQQTGQQGQAQQQSQQRGQQQQGQQPPNGVQPGHAHYGYHAPPQHNPSAGHPPPPQQGQQQQHHHHQQQQQGQPQPQHPQAQANGETYPSSAGMQSANGVVAAQGEHAQPAAQPPQHAQQHPQQQMNGYAQQWAPAARADVNGYAGYQSR